MSRQLVVLTAITGGLCGVLLGACEDTPPTSAVCGDGVADGSEECDGEDLGGATCDGTGTVSCASDCTLDRSGCTEDGCGDGEIDAGEECDGAELGGADCGSQGFAGGTLACRTTCSFDLTGCCSDSCVGGSRRCTGNVLESCSAGAAGCLEWSEEQDCADTGDVCDGGRVPPACATSCTDACTGGATRCAGDVVETCAASASGCLAWNAGTNCATTEEVCDESTGTATCVPPCIDQCTTGGASRCAGTVVETCSAGAGGCLAWIPGTDCDDSGQICEDDQSGEAACACDDECVSAGASQCNGDLIETCSANASGCLSWTPGTNCFAGGDVCDESTGTAQCVCVDACTDESSRCSGELRQDCSIGGDGCTDWVDTDCAASGETCYDAGGTPTCLPAEGEDCSAPYALVNGDNLVTWTAGQNDYLASLPPCVATGAPAGPDLVLSYTATIDGFIDITVDKAANNRMAMVVSDRPCGTLTGGTCVTELAPAAMSARIAVALGTTYWVYVIDTNLGTATLDNPLGVSVTEIPCIDGCASDGVTQCNGDVIETCSVNALGCLEWTPSSDCSAGGEFCNQATGTPQCLPCRDGCPLAGQSHCNGSAVENCTLGGSGCADWVVSVDCTSIPGAICDDFGGSGSCVLSTGEDCGSPLIVGPGTNTKAWTAATSEYFNSASCTTSGLVGPDLVLRYTATIDGYAQIDLSKPTFTRFAMTISAGACGVVTPALSCVSEYDPSTMGDLIPIAAGSTYFVYVRDTNSGSATLPNPITLSIDELPCIDACTAPGSTRCTGDAIETCQTSALGCLAWEVTNHCAIAGNLCDDSTGVPTCVPCLDSCPGDGTGRCDGSVVETCRFSAEGCLEWTTGVNCAGLGEVCFATTTTATCAALSGDTCANAWPLTAGRNTIDWVALGREYVTAAPSCQAAGSITGPDVVLSYTAQSTGYLDLSLAKPTDARYTLVASGGTCGVVTPSLDCVSNYDEDTLATVLPVTGGSTYTLYLLDTTDGAAPLPSPLVLDVSETSCPVGLAGNECAAIGASRCFAAVTPFRAPGATIPDAGGEANGCRASGALSDSLVITEGFLISDVDVSIDISHTWDEDLDLWLEHDDGTGNIVCVELSTDNGSSGENYDGTTFDDEATLSIESQGAPFQGTYRAEGALSDFDGRSMTGTWTIYINDDVSADIGTLNAWGLVVSYDGDGTEDCVAGGDGCLDWATGVDCAATGEQCADGTGAALCGPCRDTCPLVGDRRCTGDVLETCSLNPQGCVDWTVSQNCAATGDICAVASGGCVTPRGEDCGSAVPLALGTTSIDWVAFDNDYVPGAPSCQTDSLTVAPDLVFTYTATFDGQVALNLGKPANDRQTVVVSDAPCGTFDELACFSNYGNTTVGGAFEVVNGTQYTLYVAGTDLGSSPLPHPLAVSLACVNACGAGQVRCSGDLIQACVAGASGCLEWSTTGDCSLTGETCDARSGAPVCNVCTDHCPAAGADRCAADSLEVCQVDPDGCLDWALSEDCSASGGLCHQDPTSAFCYQSVADTCADPFILQNGPNTIDWNAFGREVLLTRPSCTTANLVGPDLVLQYTAQLTGFLDVKMSKPASNRYVYVVTSGPCGAVTPQVACVSDFSLPTMDALFPVSAGTTYTFYVSDTDSGSAALPEPLQFDLHETLCPTGAAGDECPASGASRCFSGVSPTRSPLLSIPDGAGDASTCGGVASSAVDSIVVTDSGTVVDVDVDLDIFHTYISDLDIWLRYSNGAGTTVCVELSTDNGSNGEDYVGTIFDDEAATLVESGDAPFTGRYAPEDPLSALDGLPMAGTWTLYVSDDFGSDSGTLSRWGLSIQSTGEGTQDCAVQAGGCLGWVTGLDCADTGELCADGTGAAVCGTCTDTCPELGRVRCSGDVAETCSLNAQGCVDWTLTEDCGAAGDVCQESAGGCITPLGDTCASPAALSLGVNRIDWLAFGDEYMPSIPSCQLAGTTVGPDIVLTYTATYDGSVSLSMSKTANNRHTVVVSDAPCGTVTQDACFSEYTASTLGGPFDVTAGTTYTLYVSDTDSGGAPLPDPLVITLSCADACAVGAQRCSGDFIQTCATGPTGCLEWTNTTDCGTSGDTCDDRTGAPTCSACTDLCATAGISRCNGTVIEDCELSALGCLEWAPLTDCTATGGLCDDRGAVATCFVPAGDTCANAIPLSEGTTTLAWAASGLEYLVSTPSCVTTATVIGPDVVLQYTAQADGLLDLTMNKPSSNRYVLVVSDAPCGDASAELSCVSEFTEPVMGDLIPITGGTTYTIYVADTDSGSVALPSPLVLTLDETNCPTGAGGDACPADGASGCGSGATAVRSPGIAIPDDVGDALGCGQPGAAADTITTTGAGAITDANVGLTIDHPYDSDLDIWLRYDNGSGSVVCVQLSTDNGSSGADYTSTIFDDEAATSITAGSAPFTGSYRPESLLSALDGQRLAGTWTLYVSDDAGSDVGVLVTWSLDVSGSGEGTQICAAQPDGCLAWTPGVSCAAGERCNTASGDALCLTCTDSCPAAGGGRCIGDSLELCTANAEGCYDWTFSADCAASGELCDEDGMGGAACAACFDACGPQGSHQCNGSVIEACEVGAVGCLEWTTFVDCDATGDVCVPGSGTAMCIPCKNSCPAAGASACSPRLSAASGPSTPIPDGAGEATGCSPAFAHVADSIGMSRPELVTDVDVRLDITHTWDSDVDIFLGFEGPGVSRCVELSTDNGDSYSDYTGTVFDDEAQTAVTAGSAPFTGSFRPETPLSVFDGLPMNGTWTLYVSDDTGIDTGVLVAWSVELAYGTSNAIATCAPQSNGCLAWDLGTECGDTGEVCDDSSGAAMCMACVDTCAAPGLTQCNGVLIEACTLGALGCLEWQVVTDCSAAGPNDTCDDGAGAATCVSPYGDDCSAPATLFLGANTVDWYATNQDYLVTDPSCQIWGDPVGPDLVLEYVADYTGTVEITIDSPSYTTETMVVSSGACGTLTPELTCDSDWSSSTLFETFDTIQGATYYVYVTTTDDGSDPLSDPLNVTLSCIASCPSDGLVRCMNDAVALCAPDVFGCLTWQVVDDCPAVGDVCDASSGTPVCAPCLSYCTTAGETRCNGDVIETCGDVGEGCLDYVGGTDCALSGEVCLDAAGAAACVVPAGEDCADPWVLVEGLNEVAWSSVVNNYVTATPSCGSGSSPAGPDVVASYTATSSGIGYLDVTMEKQPSTRHHIVVSSGTCGSLTPQVACISDFTNPAMGATFQVNGGTTYWFYVVDSTSGTNPLPNPFTLHLDELDCAIFSATPLNEAPPNGGTATTLRPEMSVDFDAPIDTSTGIIQIIGDLGTNLVYDLAANPAAISFANGNRTMLIEPGFFFPVGEQVSVTWFGLQDSLCGGPVATPVWTFIIPTPSCVPGVGGVVGTNQTRSPTTIPTDFTEHYVVPDADPAGFVYVGGTSALYRMPKTGGAIDNVATLAALTSTELGYTMVIDGQSIFVVNNVEATTGVLFRISRDGGVSWEVKDFATFPVAPEDWIRSATVHGGRIYMLTQEVSTGVDTEIWSVAVNPASIPDTAVLETAVPGEHGCSAIAMDNVNYYLACSTGDRVVRIDRTTGQSTLLTAAYDVATTVNALHADDIGGDGVADVLYMQTGTEDAYYFCDPALTPFTDVMLTWGGATDNFGLGLDRAANSLWAYDDDVEELILIE